MTFALPRVASAEDLSLAMAAISRAVAVGELTPAEAFDLARVADSFLRVIAARDAELARRRQAERAAQEAAAPRRETTFRAWMDDHFAERSRERMG